MRSLRFIIWIRVGARIFAEKRAKMRVFYKKKKNKKLLKELESEHKEVTVKQDMVTEEKILEALRQIEE